MFIIHYTQKPNQNALDLNARPETVKLLEENIKGRLKGLVFAVMFWMWQEKHGWQNQKQRRGLHQSKKFLYRKHIT